jgi:hypothetical protein
MTGAMVNLMTIMILSRVRIWFIADFRTMVSEFYKAWLTTTMLIKILII